MISKSKISFHRKNTAKLKETLQAVLKVVRVTHSERNLKLTIILFVTSFKDMLVTEIKEAWKILAKK